MNRETELFEQAPVSRAVFRMAAPTVVSSLVLVIYNMADTFFVGQTHNAAQVAAVSLTNAVFVMYMAVANLFGIGASALISMLLGEGEKQKARAVSSLCFWGSLASGMVFGGLILLFMDPLLSLLGSSQETWQYSKDYLFYIAAGAPFILLANSFGHAVRGEGAAKASMTGGMIGTVANIILDPLLILTFHMDTAGAAIATVIGNILGCIYYVWYLVKKSPLLSLRLRDMKGSFSMGRRLICIGVPAGINSALMSISTVFLNHVLLSYGDKAVAAMGIVTKAYMFIVFVHMGIANGIQPLLGYCCGAGNKERFLNVLKFSAGLTVLCGTTLTALYLACSRTVVSLFIDDAQVIDYGVRMLFATSLAGPILGILFLSINSMQALNRPLPAAILSLCRQGLFFIPLLFALNAALGLDGINFTQTAADYLSILIALGLLRASLKSAPALQVQGARGRLKLS